MYFGLTTPKYRLNSKLEELDLRAVIAHPKHKAANTTAGISIVLSVRKNTT